MKRLVILTVALSVVSDMGNADSEYGSSDVTIIAPSVTIQLDDEPHSFTPDPVDGPKFRELLERRRAERNKPLSKEQRARMLKEMDEKLGIDMSGWH